MALETALLRSCVSFNRLQLQRLTVTMEACSGASPSGTRERMTVGVGATTVGRGVSIVSTTTGSDVTRRSWGIISCLLLLLSNAGVVGVSLGSGSSPSESDVSEGVPRSMTCDAEVCCVYLSGWIAGGCTSLGRTECWS